MALSLRECALFVDSVRQSQAFRITTFTPACAPVAEHLAILALTHDVNDPMRGAQLCG